MRPHFALSTTLLLSLLIIIIGVMLIIFIQFDRGYKVPGQIPTYQREQDRLIDHLYLGDDHSVIQQERTISSRSIPETDKSPLAVSPRNDTARQYGEKNSYPLRNNPWSPYYQPER